MTEHKMEVIYYEMVKMEDRLTQKADLILKAESKVEELLQKVELLQKQLIDARGRR